MLDSSQFLPSYADVRNLATAPYPQTTDLYAMQLQRRKQWTRIFPPHSSRYGVY